MLVAAKENHDDILLALVNEFGCDINTNKKHGNTLLHEACRNGQLEVVRKLIGLGADVDKKNHNGDTPMLVAAKENHDDVLLALISEFGCDIDTNDQHGNTLLHLACRNGELGIIRKLIGFGAWAALENKNHNGNTPMLVAALNNHFDVVVALISEFGCDINTNDKHGNTLLHGVCRHWKLGMVRWLITMGAAVDKKNRDGLSPVLVAAKNDHADVVLALVSEFGCDVNIKNVNGKTLLHIACETGDMNLAQALLDSKKLNLSICNSLPNYDMPPPLFLAIRNNHENIALKLIKEFKLAKLYDPTIRNRGNSLLHEACDMGHFNLAHTLICDGAHLNEICWHGSYTDRTPLTLAVKNSMFEIARKLLDDHRKDTDGITILHLACHACNDVVQAFLQHDPSAKVDIKDKHGGTPLHIACRYGDIDMVNTLTHHDPSAKVDIKDKHGDTPLHIACRKDERDLVKTLLCHDGIKVDVENENGDTPLHIACRLGDIGTIKALLHHDSNTKIDHKNKEDDTPLHIACRKVEIDIVRVLIQHDPSAKGANVKNEDGDTPLYTACRYSDINVVKALVQYDPSAKVDINVRDSQGSSLLHIAAAGGNEEVLVMLIIEYGMSVSLVDDGGNTPLHVASKKNYYDCVKSLLYSFKSPVHIRNREGKTSRDLVTSKSLKDLHDLYLQSHNQELEEDYAAMEKLATSRYSGSHCITRLFVVGHPGAGKSSLVEILKREGFFQSLTRVSDQSVPLHTAGIVPSVYTSATYGRVQFYDFAGDPEYYSSHAAILERLFQSDIGINVFIIVLNLKESEGEIEKKYVYWYSFISNNSKNLHHLPLVLAIGSHADSLPSRQVQKKRKEHIVSLFSEYKAVNYFTLDCRNPGSKGIKKLRQTLQDISSHYSPYELSYEGSVLLGLLEKDFSNVTACTAETLVKHVQNISLLRLPRSLSGLYPLLQQLQSIGALLVLGGKEKDCYLVLNVSQLTNEVHKKLFSEDADSVLLSFNIGLLPPSLLQDILPEFITKDCLIQLQYCQEIPHVEIGQDNAITTDTDDCKFSTLPDKTLLFFPALCKLNKRGTTWLIPPEGSYSIGWLARCHPPDYFPSRFLHVLLLRVALRFTLTPPHQTDTSPGQQHLKRLCTMWETGVHWLTEEGVECEVDVDISKEVVVNVRSEENNVRRCFTLFNSIISCIMETKAEFCHSIQLHFLLLDKEDNSYLLDRVEGCLHERKEFAISITGKALMPLSKLKHIRNTFWNALFSIDERSICEYIQSVVKEWFQLGTNLQIPHHELSAIEINFGGDVVKQKEEMVAGWLSSTLSTSPTPAHSHPPCWWTLIKALWEMGENASAAAIMADHGKLELFIITAQNY